MQEIKLYKGTVSIFFDENRHMFFDENKKHLVSVTAATGIIDKSAPLMGWAVKETKNYLIEKWDTKKKLTEVEKINLIEEAGKQHRIFKKKAADIGTQIHEWASDWILGKKPEMPENENVVNGITAFLKFQKEHNVKWLSSEKIVFSKRYKYAGILDAIGKIGKELYLLDFKSSNDFYDEMRFQVAGYRLAYEEETGKKIDKNMIIRFGKETGDFECKELDGYEKDKNVFLACLAIKKRLKELSCW